MRGTPSSGTGQPRRSSRSRSTRSWRRTRTATFARRARSAARQAHRPVARRNKTIRSRVCSTAASSRPRRRSCQLLEPTSADPACRIPRFIEVRDADVFSRTSGMDEAALTHVDAVMTELIEEDEVTRLELIAGHRGSILVLPGGVVGQRYTAVSADVLDGARDG